MLAWLSDQIRERQQTSVVLSSYMKPPPTPPPLITQVTTKLQVTTVLMPQKHSDQMIIGEVLQKQSTNTIVTAHVIAQCLIWTSH